MNITARTKELIQALKDGPEELQGFRMSSVKPECEDAWSEDYAIFYELSEPEPPEEPYLELDWAKFRDDVEKFVVKFFNDPAVVVTFRWSCGEVEIQKTTRSTGSLLQGRLTE